MGFIYFILEEQVEKVCQKQIVKQISLNYERSISQVQFRLHSS